MKNNNSKNEINHATLFASNQFVNLVWQINLMLERAKIENIDINIVKLKALVLDLAIHYLNKKSINISDNLKDIEEKFCYLMSDIENEKSFKVKKYPNHLNVKPRANAMSNRIEDKKISSHSLGR